VSKKKAKGGQYEDMEVFDELPPPPPRRPGTGTRRVHYKVSGAVARALVVAQVSPKWRKLAHYASDQDARRAAHKLRNSRVWCSLGVLETAYRPMVEGDLDGGWHLFVRYTSVKLSEHDIAMNLARKPDEAAEALYGDALDGDAINVVTGASMQATDPSDGLDSEDQTITEAVTGLV
jgi:hypothetical protein